MPKKEQDDVIDALNSTPDAALAAKDEELNAREAKLAEQEAELAEKQRIAEVEARKREVDIREDGFARQDEVIDNFQSGRKAKPGQSFIDKEGRQHAGNCNSHPSKRTTMQCDCGKNGTLRYKNQ